jgi:site-specific DNA-methyltransferase (adenine-specific)
VRDSIKIIFEGNSIQAGLFRKPFKGTVASNVIKNGCGGINIDACRIGYSTSGSIASNPLLRKQKGHSHKQSTDENSSNIKIKSEESQFSPNEMGRFPANFLISHNHSETENCSPSCPTQLFPDGSVNVPTEYKNKTTAGQEMFGKMGAHKQGHQRTAFSDSGKASRFFFRFTEREEMKAYLETMIRC